MKSRQNQSECIDWFIYNLFGFFRIRKRNLGCTKSSSSAVRLEMDMQEIETEVSEMEIPSEEIVLKVLDLTITTAHAIGAERAFKEHLFKDNAKQAALVLFEVLSLGHKVYPDPHAQCSLLPGPEKEGETSMPCAAAVHRVQEYLESNAHEIQVLLAVKGDEASRMGVKSYLKLLHKMDASLSHHEIQHFIKYQMEAGKERTTMGFIDVQKAVKRAVRNLSPIPPVKYETHWCPMEEPRPCAVDGHTPFVVAVQSVKKRSRLLSSPSSSQSSILSMQSQPKSISVPSVTSSESIVEPFLKTPRDMDSATLSHLFSVVTPRQMDPAEHARRRELLEYLEMCSERAKIKKENKRRVREGELEMQKKWKGLGKGNYCLDHNGVAIPLLSLDSSMQHRTSIPVETKWQPDEEQEPEPKFNDHTLKKKRFKLRIGEAYVPKDVPELVTTRLEPGVSSFVDGRSHVGPPLRPKRGKRRLNSFRAEVRKN